MVACGLARKKLYKLISLNALTISGHNFLGIQISFFKSVIQYDRVASFPASFISFGNAYFASGNQF